jgi:hypothetical protein
MTPPPSEISDVQLFFRRSRFWGQSYNIVAEVLISNRDVAILMARTAERRDRAGNQLLL